MTVQLLVVEADSRESEAVWEVTPVLDEMLSSETATHRTVHDVSRIVNVPARI